MTLPTALLRTLLGCFAACTPDLAPFIARDPKKGKIWFDKVCRTRDVILQ